MKQSARPPIDRAPVRYPAILREAGVGGEVTASFVVDTAGRASSRSIVLEGDAHELLRMTARQALLEWRFEPARVGGRPVFDTVQVRFLFRPPLAAGARSGTRITYCSHCDPKREAMREEVRARAGMHEACARAMRELARTDPTDTLAWAVGAAPQCEGADTAAALALRLMAYGRHPDATHALRARLAAAIPTAAVFDAALAVAESGYPAAQLYALEVLDRLGRLPSRALGELAQPAERGATSCGAYIVDGVAPAPDSVRSPYAARARAVAASLAERATTAAAVRRAARCVLENLHG